MSAGDRDMLAALLAEHQIGVADGGTAYASRCPCSCGEKNEIRNGTRQQARRKALAHVADVLLASDWLQQHNRDTYAHGYHHGYKDAVYEHDAAVYGDQDEWLRDRAERAAANEYRTTENTDAAN